jgi:hypothetical protein
MNRSHEEEIRRRAHQIWEEEGRPDGKEGEHWERAAREVGDSHGSVMGTAAEGSRTERIADDLQSGKNASRR